MSEILAEISGTAKKIPVEKCPRRLRTAGSTAMLLFVLLWGNLLMTAVVLVAVDLPRGAVLLTIDLLAFLGR